MYSHNKKIYKAVKSYKRTNETIKIRVGWIYWIITRILTHLSPNNFLTELLTHLISSFLD